MTRRITIGTRGSELALTQSRWIAARLREAHPDLEVELETINTKGDKILDVPLAKIGGKGLFTKELEVELIEGRIDLAVHSLKDLPTDLPDGLAMGPVPQRETPRDALVTNSAASLQALPNGARVGTSSLRRTAQLRAWRDDLDIVDLRGNVGTRLSKVHGGEVDAAILACAGLERLGLDHEITEQVPLDVMLPAPAQGALGLELRTGDTDTAEALVVLNNPGAAACVAAERRFLATLEGGCQVPLGALATLDGDTLSLSGCVCSLDGGTSLRVGLKGAMDDAEAVGEQAANTLLDQGAADLIAEIR
jgi:hydroxymethylbilane synthase